jgi:hypothetical protein
MPAGTAARIGDREYVRAGLEELAWERAEVGVPAPVPAWKAAAIRVESLMVRGAVHGWDTVFVRWDRLRGYPAVQERLEGHLDAHRRYR